MAETRRELLAPACLTYLTYSTCAFCDVTCVICFTLTYGDHGNHTVPTVLISPLDRSTVKLCEAFGQLVKFPDTESPVAFFTSLAP